MTQNVLVTGGAGYIGAHACKALRQAGFQPVALDNLGLGQRDFVKWGPLVEADVRDRARVVQALREYDIAAVIHFAALSLVGESVSEPAKYYDNNVLGTFSLLEAMREAGVGKLVFSSTCAVYGEPAVTPITEATPKAPINPYGRAKLACEAMIEDYARAYGWGAAILRYFNAAGADPDGEIGEQREIETHLIPRALMALQGHITNFAVFGGDYPTPDGSAIRDYIHVSDLADAHVLALRRLLDGKGGGAFNLGSGRGDSVVEVLETIRRITGRPLPAPVGGRRAGDPAVLLADTSLARDVLGFDPRRSDLDSIVGDAWRWIQRAYPKLEAPTAG